MIKLNLLKTTIEKNEQLSATVVKPSQTPKSAPTTAVEGKTATPAVDQLQQAEKIPPASDNTSIPKNVRPEKEQGQQMQSQVEPPKPQIPNKVAVVQKTATPTVEQAQKIAPAADKRTVPPVSSKKSEASRKKKNQMRRMRRSLKLEEFCMEERDLVQEMDPMREMYRLERMAEMERVEEMTPMHRMQLMAPMQRKRYTADLAQIERKQVVRQTQQREIVAPAERPPPQAPKVSRIPVILPKPQQKKIIRPEDMNLIRLLEREQIFKFLDMRAGFQGKLTEMRRRMRKQEMLRVQKWIELEQQSWTKHQWGTYKKFLLGKLRNSGPGVYYAGAYLQKRAQDKPPAPSSASKKTPVVPAVVPVELVDDMFPVASYASTKTQVVPAVVPRKPVLNMSPVPSKNTPVVPAVVPGEQVQNMSPVPSTNTHVVPAVVPGEQVQNMSPVPTYASTDTHTVPAVAPGEQAPPPGTNDARAVSETIGELTQSQEESKEENIKSVQQINPEKIQQQSLQVQTFKEDCQKFHSQGIENSGTHPINQQTEPPGAQITVVSGGTDAAEIRKYQMFMEQLKSEEKRRRGTHGTYTATVASTAADADEMRKYEMFMEQLASKEKRRPGTHDTYTATAESAAADAVEVQKFNMFMEKLRITSKQRHVAPNEDRGAHDASTATVESSGAGERIYVDSRSASKSTPGLLHILTDNSPSTFWHKVIVVSPSLPRRVAVTAINRRLYPLKLQPCFFRMENNHLTFLVNNCNEALFILIKRELLRIPYYRCASRKIELALVLRAEEADIPAALYKILMKRLDPEKKFLDLSFLLSMPEFQELACDSYDTPRILHQLLTMAPLAVPRVVSLSVAGNDLKSVNCLRAIFTNHAAWQALRVLDLSCNAIMDVTQVDRLRNLALVELHLDQNPLCARFHKTSYYPRTMKLFFPYLRKLDGTYLHDTEGLPYWKQNYIYCGGSSAPGELADQFVEQFFTLYDGEDRSQLRGLYHEDAYFSLSFKLLTKQKTKLNARLAAYKAESRNLLCKAETEQNTAALCQGAENVLAKLARLPRTQHDPYSFTVDLFYNIGSSTCLTVTGVFRESGTEELTSPRRFMRTFVLIALENDEYQIVNDILYVSNATIQEAREAFRYTRPHDKKRPPWCYPNDEEKDSMVDRVSELTGMKIEWSHKCLDDCDWDMKEALQVFIELYKEKKIPDEAFKSHVSQQTVEE